MLFIVGAGLMQIPAIRIAKEMGLRTIVTDYNPEAPGLALADVPVVMSTKDIEGTVRVARQYQHKIRGIITVGTDASLTVAAVAGALGLVGIHYEAAENATHKLKMRKALRAAGVAVPDFAGVWTIDEAKAVADRIGYPVVMKPVDNMGARGVIRVENITQVENSYRHAKSCSTSGEVLVEKLMEGPELSIDALVYDGEILCTGIADRIIARPPYFIELGHTLPSSEPAAIQESAVELMRKAVKALGITFGAAKGDVKLTPSGPMIGECAARLSGGWMSSHTFPLSSGYSMIRGAIEIAIGRKPDIPEFTSRVAMERAIIAAPGRITRIEGVPRARRLSGVNEVIIKAQVGDTVSTPTSNLDKQGHVIAVADSREECEGIVGKALKAIRIETQTDHVLAMPDVHIRARNLFGKWCRACRVCDGVFCAGMVPGMGGIGTGQSFMNNLEALARYRMIERLVHDVTDPVTRKNFLGIALSLPVIAAPVTGAVTNMGGATTEEEFAAAMVQGARAAGTISCVGDGATPEKYRIGLQEAAAAQGFVMPVFKPRAHNEVMTRVRAAEAAGCRWIGMDIDGAAFVTMKAKGQSVAPKTLEQIRAIVSECQAPFFIKGVMNPRDAELAVKAGAKGLIVGNHGGRVMDQMPGGAEVLPEIVAAVRGSAVIVLDGGIRTGEDILKALALGADFCMIGRPVAIAAVGGGAEAVTLYWSELKAQLERVMILTGTASCDAVDAGVIAPVMR
jgi:biotin carboxylase/isopentenyl diphosphate isomerase/L-lactate dehydrogenase-like FMN-dependent dehydrogenase